MRVLGFSGIDNGEFYRLRYGLRFVGHDAAVALVVDGKVDPACLPSMDDLEGAALSDDSEDF